MISALGNPAVGAAATNALTAAIGISAFFGVATLAIAGAEAYWQNRNGRSWSGTFDLQKFPFLSLPGQPTYAFGEGILETYTPLAERVTTGSIGRSYTLNDLNKLKIYTRTKFDVFLQSPDISASVGASATNMFVFLGPFILSNLKYSAPLFAKLSIGNLTNPWERSGGVLELGTAFGFAKKFSGVAFISDYDVLKYDPFELGIIVGVSFPTGQANL